MDYQPGLHILSRIYSEDHNLLTEFGRLQVFLEKLISDYDLHKVGEVFYPFENAGYTGVVCLTESHIAFHTWPEYRLLTLDIYLSNHQKNNEHTSKKILDEILLFFNATHHLSEEVLR
jgi:S-adenosylmethionine decarboxylase